MVTQQNERAVTALLGKKLGMTQVWDDNGRLVPVTVVAVGANVVTQVRSAETDGYAAVQLAYGEIKPTKVTKPLKGHIEKAGATPRRHVAEIRTSGASEFTLGQEIRAAAFEAGAVVDVIGTTKGKGTAGVMKRHGFHGVGASHGAHRNHRKPGSIGGGPPPRRGVKGLKKGGRPGHGPQTTPNTTLRAIHAPHSPLRL